MGQLQQTHPVIELLLIVWDVDLGRVILRWVAVVPVSRVVARMAPLELLGAEMNFGQRLDWLASWGRLEQGRTILEPEPALMQSNDAPCRPRSGIVGG